MKTFLTHSYLYQLDPKQWKNKTPYPPLGTITALAVLEQIQNDVEFYDIALDPTTEKCIQAMQKYQPNVVVVYEDGFNYLTKMCLTNMRYACFELLKSAKAIGAKTIVSSSDATDHFKLYLENGADIVMHGEGEQSLKACIHAIENNTSLEEIQGISFIHEGEISKNPPRQNLKDLDELPTAKWSAIQLNEYKKIWESGKFPFTLNISTTRGCPFKCNWCAKPIYGNRYTSRSPERVVEEIRYLVEKTGARNFWITDDIFGLKPGWVHQFRQLIEEKQLNIRYKIQSRADLLLTETNIEDLAASGLDEVWIGAESGSQKILDAMDKGITLGQIKEATQLLKANGVRVAYFLQFGYLGETADDIRATFKMVKENQPDDIGISVSYPLPGTKFFDTVKEQMGSKSNWEDSDDLSLMFRGTYDSAFYKKLQRFVHHTFRTKQGIEKWQQPSKRISWRYAMLVPYNFALSKLLKPKF
ncbi:MAG: B12-binding domain-containing radical SAM protein [Fluviicola sp.]|nr:B12-binding domain-containing radical SAM protein [Fluviicola sp.]